MAAIKNKQDSILSALVMGVISIFFIWSASVDFVKFYRLSKEGKGAVAVIVEYKPYTTRGRSTTTVHHRHIITFNGYKEKINLSGPEKIGSTLQIVYLPKDPSTLALGKPGMNLRQLRGDGEFFGNLFIALMGIVILIIAIVSIRRQVKNRGIAGGKDAPAPQAQGFNTQTANAGINTPENGPFDLSGSELAQFGITQEDIRKAAEGAAPGEKTVVFEKKVTRTFKMPGNTAAGPKVQGSGPIAMGQNFSFAANQSKPVSNPGVKPADAGTLIASNRYGMDVLDGAFDVMASGPDDLETAISMKYGHLTKPQILEIIAAVEALEQGAGGIFTFDRQASVNQLKKKYPGFSDETYQKAIG